MYILNYTNDQLPNTISGFLSAALLNLKNMTEKNIEIHSYFMNRQDSLTSPEEFMKIKNQYLDAGIKVIDL